MKEIHILNAVYRGGAELARTLRAQYWKNNIRNFIPRHDGYAANAILYKDENMNSEYIRKLTPSENFRLMDMDEENIQKLVGAKDANGKQLVSNTRLYAAAGNGIVTACLEFIFHNMFIGIPDTDKVDDNGQYELF